MWIVDTKKEHLAIDEAHKLGIPVIAILDTNCDPDEVQYPIPGNDDAIRSVALLTRIIADAAAEGLIQRHQKPEEGEAVEPLAAWEAELLGQAEAAPASEAAPLPVEENDVDAAVAQHDVQPDATIVPEHHVESDAELEAEIEATATAEEKKPAAAKKAAAAVKKPAAAAVKKPAAAAVKKPAAAAPKKPAVKPAVAAPAAADNTK